MSIKNVATEDFMLQSESAKHLYHDFSKNQPIFDYHCHLEPQQIAEDYEFRNVTELWLGGDHYKWRAMRAMGIDEKYITGDASDEDKFRVWAETVPNTLGNPLFHWTALELKTYFDVDEVLTGDNWKEIYDHCNKVIKEKGLTARTLIKNSNVTFIGTTDNPFDSLEFHKQIAEDDSFDVTVAPSFRPDGAFKVNEVAAFAEFIEKMEAANGITINSYATLKESLYNRIEFFVEHGCKASDHGLTEIGYIETTEAEAEAIFQKGFKGVEVSKEEYIKFQSLLNRDLGRKYHEEKMVFQLHFGAIRNNFSQIFELVGPDAGVDSINDQANVAAALNGILDSMGKTDQLPKTILYPLNPGYFDIAGTTAANFQANKEGIKSKVQLGSGWWFNDTKYGMLKQFKSLAEAGLLMNFVGMLTDSRSFISYTRHDYFRRLFCDYVGDLVERGEIPNDDSLLEKLITGVSYENALEYFDFK